LKICILNLFPGAGARPYRQASAPSTYLYSTTGWCEPFWDDIGFPWKLLLPDSLWKLGKEEGSVQEGQAV
jgi:hypothetical protein